MNIASRSVLLATLVVAVSACGNKGPLVLPEKPAPVQPVTPAQAPEPRNAKGTTPPVQATPQPATNAPTSADQKADDAIDDD